MSRFNSTMNGQAARRASSQNGAAAKQSPGSNPESDKGNNQDGTEVMATSKPKRVRTGCLTCRERHLKCDEAQPICQNCRKSSRQCKRGMRLNFIDTQTQKPPVIVPPTQDYQLNFKDESRDIAAEYRGGLARYGAPEKEESYEVDAATSFDFNPQPMGAPQMQHQALPPINGLLPVYPNPPQQQYQENNNDQYMNTQVNGHSATASTFSDPPSSSHAHKPSFEDVSMMAQQSGHGPPCLKDPDEVLYMQVFVEEVGLWMDSMDADKTFSRILPFHALRQPMLKFAFLACGARHLTLVNSAYPEAKALNYYNIATQYLLRSLQNPERDSALCATTAVILNVYEIMSEKALQRMNHIAGARALIKECGWNAKSKGIGGACFWLNVGLEVHSCLHFNWAVAWEPDDWGFDLNMMPDNMPGHEELWVHKILYVIAKVANFRAQTPRFKEATPQAEQMRLNHRIQIWTHLKGLCDRWLDCIPDSMHQMAYIPAGRSGKSAFPEVWFVKRATVVARLFYHTSLALLGGTHPAAAMDPALQQEMHEMKVHHSRMICGIVAHVKDRGVASASIRCLAIAGDCLVDHREQEETIDMFHRIKKETGWRVDFLITELKERWGWNNGNNSNQQQFQAQQSFNAQTMSNGSPPNGQNGSFFTTPQGMPTMPPVPAQPPPSRPKFPSGIVNPMYAAADFTKPQHPYQTHYVPPAVQSLSDTAMFHFGL